MGTDFRENSTQIERLRSRERGLTLLELLIAMFVISILAMVGLPTYKDYTVRSKVTKDFALVNKAKSSVQAFYSVNQRFPNNNREAGMDNWSFSNFKIYLGSFGSYDGTIILVYNTTEIPELDGWETLVFYATEVNGRLQWDCTRSGSMPNKYRPSVCRR